jgi:hypothetical protein
LIGLELKFFHLEYFDKYPLRPSTWNDNNDPCFKELTLTFDCLSIFAQGAVDYKLHAQTNDVFQTIRRY